MDTDFASTSDTGYMTPRSVLSTATRASVGCQQMSAALTVLRSGIKDTHRLCLLILVSELKYASHIKRPLRTVSSAPAPKVLNCTRVPSYFAEARPLLPPLPACESATLYVAPPCEHTCKCTTMSAQMHLTVPC